MPRTAFWTLADNDRRDALAVAASISGRPTYLLEKDVWVVQTLSTLAESAFGSDLVLKGGTSLSKAYNVIHRFSEDLDVTYNIRAIAQDLVESVDGEPIPPSRKKTRTWTSAIRKRLASWVGDQALPTIEEGMSTAGLSPSIQAQKDCIYITYTPLFADYSFVRPEVMVEFGARSTGEPCEERLTPCDAAAYLPEVSFPEARPLVMAAERTFWEKATAIHVFCRQQSGRGERLSRHWHDLVRLDDAGYADSAIANRPLALQVAEHKSMFFRERDVERSWVDYIAAVSGDLQLVPESNGRAVLSEDYDRMIRGGMLFADEETFDALMARSKDLENRANRH